MKKIKILKQPARIDELGLENDIDLYDDSVLRLERLEIKQLRKFRHQLV